MVRDTPALILANAAFAAKDTPRAKYPRGAAWVGKAPDQYR